MTGGDVTQGRASGKVILFGEHAVVYGRPAIAVPVTDVQATARVEDAAPGSGILIHAPDIGQTIDVATAPADEPLSFTVRRTLARLGRAWQDLDLSLTLVSSIPVASGLGSGAAVVTAIVRALTAHLGCPLDKKEVSSIVYETEKIFHGTPSGIDNTVIAFEQPVYFVKGRLIEPFAVRRPFWIAIADTGLPSLTRESVADVRAAWQRDRQAYEAIFDRVGAVADAARAAIEEGRIAALGALMAENQRLLRRLDVSLPELERLIEAAQRAGAQGAKLSGGGRGGNMIALIEPQQADAVRAALQAAGAKRVIVTEVGK